MIDNQALEYIEGGLHSFGEGIPIRFEVLIAEGVTFTFDKPFEQDLVEYLLPVSVEIESWSPHNYGEPVHTFLEDYGPEEIEDLVCDLDAAIYNGGSRNDYLNFEYSPSSSDPINNRYVFTGSIQNPRRAVLTGEAHS